jgi:hypothetical protein
MYEPRRQFLELVGQQVGAHGLTLEVLADKYSTSNDDYWRVLATSDIILTTTMQGMPRHDLDWIWVRQLVFRFSEALAAGAVLVAQSVPGMERVFDPGRDFATFTSVDEASAALVALAENQGRREGVRDHGHSTAERMMREHEFWRAIDARLGVGAMRLP